MGDLKTKEIEKKRNYLIAKRNDLIQQTRFSLESSEQAILMHLISKIQPNDDDFKICEFNIKEFCKLCCIQETNGKNHINLKKSIDSLKSKSFWIFVTSTYEVQIDWIEYAAIDHEKNCVYLKLNNLLKPYLLNLIDQKKPYSLLDFPVFISLQSKYSKRLYELLKSYEKMKKKTLLINDLKIKIDADNYGRFPDFKRRALDPALKEINIYADFKVDYNLIKTAKANTHIEFLFSKKTAVEHYDTIKLIDTKLKPISKENQIAFTGVSV